MAPAYFDIARRVQEFEKASIAREHKIVNGDARGNSSVQDCVQMGKAVADAHLRTWRNAYDAASIGDHFQFSIGGRERMQELNVRAQQVLLSELLDLPPSAFRRYHMHRNREAHH